MASPAKGLLRISLGLLVLWVLFVDGRAIGQTMELTEFSVVWHGAAPPQIAGVPGSQAWGTNWSNIEFGFGVWLRLGEDQPTSGWVLEADSGGSMSQVFQLTNLFFRSYPAPDGPQAYSYEQGARITAGQLDALLESRWYVEVNLPGQTYLGQFVPVPENSTGWLGYFGGLLLFVGLRRTGHRRIRRGNHA